MNLRVSLKGDAPAECPIGIEYYITTLCHTKMERRTFASVTAITKICIPTYSQQGGLKEKAQI